MNCTETRQWLAAHCDGELDLARDAEIIAHLHACPGCADAAQARGQWKSALRESAPRFTPTSALAERIRSDSRATNVVPFQTTATKADRKRNMSFASALLPIAAALALGYVIGQQRSTSHHLGEELLANDTFALVTPEHLTEVTSTDRHTVKPWLSQHLDFSPPVVDLASDGFPLSGGRVDRLENQAVAALVYHRHNHVITVFVWPKDGERLPGDFAEHGYRALSWQQGDWNFVAIADLPAEDLANFADRLKSAVRTAVVSEKQIPAVADAQRVSDSWTR